MSTIRIESNVPFVSVIVRANGFALHLDRVLLDTGSGTTIFKTNLLETIGVKAQGSDIVRVMTGIGGSEHVVEKIVDSVEVNGFSVSPFRIEIGAMNYGFPLDGILGMDFLLGINAIIDLDLLELRVATS